MAKLHKPRTFVEGCTLCGATRSVWGQDYGPWRTSGGVRAPRCPGSAPPLEPATDVAKGGKE